MTKIIPCDIFFWAAGFTPCQSYMFVHKEHINNNALIKHELKHVEQMKNVGTFKWWFLYLFSPLFRQSAEVEAYKVQIENGMLLSEAAQFLSTMYHLDLTYDQAAKLLS
jgi:hypothetical protein